MGEAIVGGLIGLLGVFLGWFLSFIERQGRIDATELKVRVIWLDSRENIAFNPDRSIRERRYEKGEKSMVECQVLLLSYSREMQLLKNCKLQVQNAKFVNNINQVIITSEDDEDQSVSDFSQIVLSPLKTLKVKTILYFDTTPDFPQKELKIYLSYKTRLGLPARKFLGVWNLSKEYEYEEQGING